MLALQDPTSEESPLLHENLLEAASNSTSGGGAFAWATVGGLGLLIDDDFLEFVESSSFRLAIGVQSVTTPAALEKMVLINKVVGRQAIDIFLPDDESSLFHPKYTWFESSNGGILVIGSGNLTLGGLRDSWEAYASVPLSEEELQEVKTVWERWVEENAENFLSPDNEEVISRAEKNTGWTKRKRPRHPDKVGATDSGFEATEINKVLISEIPKASTRWKQANFDMKTYEAFFGAKIGTQRRMLFQSVDAHGQLGDIERRPSVEVGSQNYRFELNAASGLDYPDSGRPIAVFLRLRTRAFLYRLSLPNRDESHDELVDFVESNKDRSPTSQIRRIEVNLNDASHLSDIQKLVEKADGAFADE